MAPATGLGPLTPIEILDLWNGKPLPADRRYSFVLSLQEDLSDQLLQLQVDQHARADQHFSASPGTTQRRRRRKVR